MTTYTHVFRNLALPAMQALAATVLPALKWRHHGIGCLQGYVIENTDPEIRIHIWSPALIKPGMTTSGDTHDHRFDMTSHVLAGTICHKEVITESHPEGKWITARLTHARAAADTNYDGPMELTGERLSAKRNRYEVPAGWSYTFPAGQFHRSPVSDLAVTCIEKHAQKSAPARILFPINVEPVHAFGHELDAALVQQTVRAAEALLHAAIRQ